MKTDFESTFNTTPTGVIVQLADGSIQSCNKQAEQILGYSTSEMTGVVPPQASWQIQAELPFPSNTHPAIAFYYSRGVASVLATGEPAIGVKIGFYQSDNNLIWLLLDSQPLFSGSNDKPSGVMTTFQNITGDRPQVDRDRDRQNSYDDFQVSAEAIPGVLYLFDLVSQRNIYLNSQAYDLLGYTSAEIRAMGDDFMPQVIHPQDFAQFPAHFARVERSQPGAVLKLEYRMRHRNGTWRWFCSEDQVYRRTADGKAEQILGIARDVSDRKQTEIALEENEERLKLAIVASGTGMWFWDLIEETLDWTDRCKTLFGIPLDAEPSYEKFLQLLHPEDRDRTHAAVESALANHAEYNTEYRIVWPDGSIHWIAAKGKGIYNQDDRAVQMIGTVVDVTNLRRSQQQLRILLDSLPICTGFLTPDGVVTEVNQAALHLADLQPEEVLNKHLRETYWWSDEPQIQLQIDNAIRRAAAGEIVRFDILARAKENLIVTDFGIVPKFNHRGQVEYLVPFWIDISDREATKQALKHREHELELITKVIPQQIWTAAKDGHLDYINQRWQDYTGLNLEQMRELGWASIVHPDQLPSVMEGWIQAVKTKTQFAMEIRLRSADETYDWFLCKARPLRTEQGEIVKWYGTNTKITKIKELEQKLIQQTEDLIQANQLKDEFLAIVSHELRTPLNPILGWSQLLSTGRLDADRTAQGLAIIERNAKLQAQLIDDLLDVSKILRGKLNLNKVALNLESVIRTALTTVQLAAEAKSIQIETEFESDVGRVSGDAARLQQIIWNLITNAIKFTPAHGRIFVRLKRINTQALIEVEDTGRGIEPEFIPYAFERFRQADSANTREFGGLGLGLAIVRHLCELHGGTVTVSSPGLNRGTTFSVRLPLLNTPTPQQIDLVGDRSAQQNRFEGLTILAIDDEADSLEILTLVLSQEGGKVISVASAAAALEVFKQTTPNLIISDIGMPYTDGYTLIAQIRQLPQAKNIPAIALTAYAGEIERQRSFDAGFQKHIAKPINIPELITAIGKLTDVTH